MTLHRQFGFVALGGMLLGLFGGFLLAMELPIPAFLGFLCFIGCILIGGFLGIEVELRLESRRWRR